MIISGDPKKSCNSNQDVNKFVLIKHSSLIEEEKDLDSQSNKKLIGTFNQNKNLINENDRIINCDLNGHNNMGSGDKYLSPEKNIGDKFINKKDNNDMQIESIFENNLANKSNMLNPFNDPVKQAISPIQSNSNKLGLNLHENMSGEENIILPNVESLNGFEDNVIKNEDSNKVQMLNAPVELLIHPADGTQAHNFYCITQEGGKIGRHSDNHIVLLEESVSRHHSVIEYQDGRFYLIDIGSTTGTFIKIDNIIKLEEGLILELGSNQFQIVLINSIDENEGLIKLKIIEGPKFGKDYEIMNSLTIGRKNSAPDSLTFQDDFHLSNIHAKITYSEGEFLFEDQNSTNG